MDGDCPACFAKFEVGSLQECKSCRFTESCKYCYENDDNSVNKRLGHVSYEKFCYSEDIASKADFAEDSECEKSDVDNNCDTRTIMEFLLDLDNYTAELVSEVLHGGCCTSSDLAKKFGVSRQAIHRKLVDCCTEHPELRKLFISRLYRCRRIMRNSERLEQKRNQNQMEFNF